MNLEHQKFMVWLFPPTSRWYLNKIKSCKVKEAAIKRHVGFTQAGLLLSSKLANSHPLTIKEMEETK